MRVGHILIHKKGNSKLRNFKSKPCDVLVKNVALQWTAWLTVLLLQLPSSAILDIPFCLTLFIFTSHVKWNESIQA